MLAELYLNHGCKIPAYLRDLSIGRRRSLLITDRDEWMEPRDVHRCGIKRIVCPEDASRRIVAPQCGDIRRVREVDIGIMKSDCRPVFIFRQTN